LSAEGQQGGAAAVGEETEVADADKAAGQQVEKEAAQELIGGQRHESFPVAVNQRKTNHLLRIRCLGNAPASLQHMDVEEAQRRQP